MNSKRNKIALCILLLAASALFTGCQNKKSIASEDDSKSSHPEEAIGENMEEPAPWDSSDN